MKGIYKSFKLACFLFFIPLLLASCNHTNIKKKKLNPMDSLHLQAKDSVSANPEFAKACILKILPKAPDSLTHYEWMYTYALSCIHSNQMDSAKKWSSDILKFCERQTPNDQLTLLTASSANLMGNYYTYMFEADSSIFFYQKALTLYGKLPDRSAIPDIYINLADANIRKGDYANGVYYYRKALLLSDSLGLSDTFHFPIYAGLGQAYMDLRDYETSENYWEKAEKDFSKRSLQEQFFYCNNRGNSYYYQELYSKSLPWSRKALDIVRPGQYMYSIGLCYLNLSDLFLNLNELDSASCYIEQCKRIFPYLDNASSRHYLTTIQAGIALKKGNLTEARLLLRKNKQHQGVEQNLVGIRNQYLQEYYAKTGDFRQAYRYLLNNTTMNDSLRHDRALKLAATYDMQYKLDTTLIGRNILIASQSKDMHLLRTQRFFMVVAGTLFVILVLLFFFYIRKKNKLQKLELTDRLNRLRLQNIRNRISPHFIFNTLNSIQGEVTENSERKDLLSLLLRKSLEMTEESSITIKEELSFVETYIRLEKANLGEQFLLEWEIDSTLNTETIKVPSMIIQIQVENAIKHALMPKKGLKILHVGVAKRPGGVSIVVKDNGDGYNVHTTGKTRGTGTGLKVMQQTVHLLNEKNTTKILFEMRNVAAQGETGAVADIFIPENYRFDL